MGTAVYVPILKGKEGEFAALEVLSNDVRNQIRPFIEIPGVAYDYSNDRPSKSLDDHISSVANRLGRCWKNAPIYVDFSWIEADERLQDGGDPIEGMLEQCLQLSVPAIPVVTRTTSATGLSAVGRYSRSTGNGCCVRLLLEDFEEEVELETEIARMFRAMSGAQIELADLVLDFEDIGNDSSRAVLLARSVLSMIPLKDQWRCVVLSAASFPEDLSEVDASTISLLPRREWHLWKTLQRRPNVLPRRDLVFGDYAIAHPIPRELDPRTMRMSANIRYTAPDDWLIVKGRNVRQYGFEQYFDLCRLLTQRQEYSGRQFSWGDNFIFECAAGTAGPGNATTWRKVGTNHHITMVVRSLAEV